MDSPKGCRSRSSWRISSCASRMYARQARCSSSVSQRGGLVRGAPSVRGSVVIRSNLPVALGTGIARRAAGHGVAALAAPAKPGAVTSSTMSETAATNRERRLAWLDALRGFAALCVVFDHGSTLLLLPARSFLYHWFNLGQYGVFVFFLVSGYIVPASLERKGSVRGFWISRAFRLYPMFLVVLLLSAVAYETGHGTVANAGAHPLTAALGWVFMLQNLVAGLNVPVVIWTLSYEMVFYLLLAALFSWGIHRRSGWYATAFAVGAVALGGVLPLAVLSRSWPAKAGASLAGLVALVLVTVNQTYPYPWAGCVILGLMFTGTMIHRAEQEQVSRRLTAVVTVGVFALLTLAGVWHGAQRHEDHTWQVQWATSVLLAGVT